MQQKSAHAEREEEILAFWKEKGIFEKTLGKKAPKGDYTFYDGPPFATGTPHYGHILASAIKDAVPRFWTMRGYRVERRWGWDCHGLPIENIVENDLKISGRKQIEEYGVGKFNEYARSKVLNYVHEWKKTVDRMGRWVDFDGSYKTMDNTYVESVWWAFKELHEKGLIYEGTRVLPYCPRCETPIANSEIAMDNSYKEIKDISVFVKFQLKDEPNTYLLAWTTTPWTLPGNFALAVNPEIDYAYVRLPGGEHRLGINGSDNEWKKDSEDVLIVAKQRVEEVFSKAEYQGFEIVKTVKGSELVGREYKPLFDYFADKEFKNKENAWKIYDADFVTTTDGTGMVHVAPGYGEDDMKLAEKNKIPFIHHVTHDGKFTAEIKDFAGLQVKPKDTKEEPEKHLKADIEMIKHLDAKKLLFAKESIRHSYPHCYRCETPLYYYAIPAWFVRISEAKSKMLKLNEKINWIPEHLKHGRFGKSMESAPDWNISRNRFWASPLPVWKCEKCKELKVVGSLDDISKNPRNSYWVMRHGEAEGNVKKLLNGGDRNRYHLTEAGRRQTAETAEAHKREGIELIYTSPFLRTVETAEIVRKTLGLAESQVIVDERLREVGFGEYNEKPIEEFFKDFPWQGRFENVPAGGEKYGEVKKRVGDLLYELEAKHEGKKILVISHGTPSMMLLAAVGGLDRKQSIALEMSAYMEKAELRKIDFSIRPHNDEYELDLHRPYIDGVTFKCKCGGEMKRISEVMDCWFESGSMPFAAAHYPFENKDWFKKHFPGQFVAEYIAQTRTWFYYMHALSAMLFKKIPFENVVTTGTILAEDGQKMSKSKNNFPNPLIVFDKYGADAVRYYLLSSPLMKSEDLNFCEKDVDAVSKKIILRLSNVLSFYKLYAADESENTNKKSRKESQNTLDRWIVSRLNQLKSEVTDSMNAYELDKATRPFVDFIDDLSTWYLRRSRDRFKGEDKNDKDNALGTTRFTLIETAKLLAPFTPFLAEYVYREVGGELESVHLEEWPEGGEVDLQLIGNMEKVRTIASLGLEARMATKIIVRQPLLKLKVKGERLKVDDEQLIELIKDEVNVKEVVFDGSIESEVELDVTITSELKEEGELRELMRKIQDMRKEKGLSVGDKARLTVTAELKALADKYGDELKKATGLEEIEIGDALELRV